MDLRDTIDDVAGEAIYFVDANTVEFPASQPPSCGGMRTLRDVLPERPSSTYSPTLMPPFCDECVASVSLRVD
jgi:hypothetical protein